MRRTVLCSLAWGMIVLGGCDRGSEEEIAPEPEARPAASVEAEGAPSAAAPAADEPTQAQEEAGPSAAGEGYELHAQTVGPYAAGEAGTFALNIEARDDWHLNEDYPTRIDVSGPAGVAFPKAALEKADAAEFGELTARFDVPFRAAEAGAHAVEAKVSFAICTPQTCIPTERTLALQLPVE